MSPLAFPGEEPKAENSRPYIYKLNFLAKNDADSYFDQILKDLQPKMGPADTYGRMKNGQLDCSTAYSGYRQSLWIGPEINPGRSAARRCSHGPEQENQARKLREDKSQEWQCVFGPIKFHEKI